MSDEDLTTLNIAGHVKKSLNFFHVLLTVHLSITLVIN